MEDIQSLAHSKWNCKYHIVFAPKYRRQVIYGKLKAEIGKILRSLCERKGVEVLEAEACADHIHMLVSIPPSMSVADFMGYPVDTSRVYATGTSMGGMASISLVAAYPELIAAIAPSDIAPSLTADDAQIARLQELVMPMNFTTGLADKYAPYPLSADSEKIEGYNQLLSALDLQAYAMDYAESVTLANESVDIVEHATGVRFPNVKAVNYENNRLYVCDFENEDGVALLRINLVENKPHMFVGYDAQNAWNFLKQFSRNQKTGALEINN